jgi:hypothetical protein
MNYEDLDQDEQLLIQRWKAMKKAKQAAVRASENSFINWIKNDVPEIWHKVSSYVKDLWNWFKGLF